MNKIFFLIIINFLSVCQTFDGKKIFLNFDWGDSKEICLNKMFTEQNQAILQKTKKNLAIDPDNLLVYKNGYFLGYPAKEIRLIFKDKKLVAGVVLFNINTLDTAFQLNMEKVKTKMDEYYKVPGILKSDGYIFEGNSYSWVFPPDNQRIILRSTDLSDILDYSDKLNSFLAVFFFPK